MGKNEERHFVKKKKKFDRKTNAGIFDGLTVFDSFKRWRKSVQILIDIL